MSQCLQFIVCISLLSVLNLGQLPSFEDTISGDISCGKSISGYATNCVPTCFVCWYFVYYCCWRNTTKHAYKFIMPSASVSFSTCNSKGIADDYNQEAIALWHLDSNNVWSMIDGEAFQNQSYCNADLGYYPKRGKCTLCENGVHEVLTADFLNPGEIYYIQIWVGSDDQHYQIDMECSYSDPPLITTPYVLSTTSSYTTTMTAYTGYEGIHATDSIFANSSTIVIICAASVVLCCVAILCIVIKSKLKSRKMLRILSLPQQAAQTTHAIQSNCSSDPDINDILRDTDVSKGNMVDIEKHRKNMEEVKQWLESEAELPQYFQVFVENGYDSMNIVIEIKDENELKDIGIQMKGHQKFIMKAIEALRDNEGQIRNEGVQQTA